MQLLVGKSAPNFRTKGVVDGNILENMSLKDYLGKYVFFFFYPLDFTFVCPTELHAFQEILPEFKKRDAEIIGCSVDSPFSHLAWSQTPKNRGGIQGITYPLLSDLNKEIARGFGVLNEEKGVSLRAQFLVDPKGIIRHSLINDLEIGRSASEALRLLDALIHCEKYGEVCPANWRNGDRAMTPTQEGVVHFFKES
jgi:peroxiredoxin 2/4